MLIPSTDGIQDDVMTVIASIRIIIYSFMFALSTLINDLHYFCGIFSVLTFTAAQTGNSPAGVLSVTTPFTRRLNAKLCRLECSGSRVTVNAVGDDTS